MGDADVRTEHEILKQFDVHADVLKVGHHGSYTSTSETFIKKWNRSLLFYRTGVIIRMDILTKV